MAKQREGILQNLLDCAAQEFLEKGYENASLRIIAKQAGTTTGTIYSRFKDKADLFHAIINPAIEEIESLFENELNEFDAHHREMPVEQMFQHTSKRQDLFIDFLYDNHIAFKLLVCCSIGTELSDLIKKLSQMDASYTLRYIDSINNDAVTSGRLTPDILDLISITYWSGLFKTIEMDMAREDAYKYAFRLRRFFRCGWRDIFFPQDITPS